MKKLNFNHLSYEADRIVKTNDSIIGYNGDIVIFKFIGINDFNNFELEAGLVFDEPEPNELDILRNFVLEKEFRLIMKELEV